MAIKVGDKVKTSATKDYNGRRLSSSVRKNTYDVIQVNGNRVVIGKGKAVTAAVKSSTITVISSKAKSTSKAKNVKKSKKTNRIKYKENKLTSKGIESGLTKLLYSNNSEEMLKYNMRLFGLPSQFTAYCDYRTYSVTGKNKHELIGRKFIENIMLEAPVITIVPGKPLYLPGAKNKAGTSYSLLAAANGSMSALVAGKNVANDQKLRDKLRYYDFQSDYITYMKYVNILCATAASFLDLNKTKLDGVALTQYDWKNYRWNASKYEMASTNVLKSSVSATASFIDKLKSYGKKVFNAIQGKDTKTDSTGKVNAFSDKTDKSVLSALEEILTQTNFVQFYVDSSSGVSESMDNTTASSKLEGMLESGSELMKEVAFLANSGGIDASEISDYLGDAADFMNNKILSKANGSIGGVMKRILSAGKNVIKGDNMIFPEIYQSSKYSKSYSISVDLKAPYGNKLSYYLNVLVPLLHLIALAIPKQTTANTYGAPFLIKAFYPGVFSTNMGIVSSIQIDKNVSSESWTVDGFPNEIRVTLNITDLYSDLTMTPAGDIMLFVSNSSLVEYLATNCGVNLTVPQLKKRVDFVSTTVKQALGTIDDTVNQAIFGKLEGLISSLVGV